jgi:CobQ-like glutamine amidotransferase family enzyme
VALANDLSSQYPDRRPGSAGAIGAWSWFDDQLPQQVYGLATRTSSWYERIPGLGLADLETVREPGPRLIGNIEIEVDLGDGPRELAGFENHGGRTYLGDGADPLGRVVRGHGNNGTDGLEGVRRRNMIGTYLHGPLLPKNAWLADRLIQLALARREGAEPELAPLDDTLEAAAHESARQAALRG